MAELVEAALCLRPRPLRNRDAQRLPQGTCDSHFHVFKAGAPLASVRSYTPQMETLSNWLALADSFGIARGVLVQPSVYGTDNRVLLEGLAQHGQRLRGIVVIPPATPPADLRRLDQQGVRGVRVNLRNKAGLGLEAVAHLARHLDGLGWHLQFQIGPDQIGTVADLATRHGVVAVIDHLAFIALDDPGTALDDLDRALATGQVYVKVSAPYRLSDAKNHQFYRQTLQMLAVRYPNRLLWGTDWPHTELFETMPEEDDLIALALAAIPAEAREQVFVRNPDALYWSH